MRGRLRSALLGASILAAPASHAATHIRGYGVDRLDLPTTNAEASAYRYDLDGDGASENQFGGVLAVFAGNFNIDMDAINGEAIDAGEIVNLIELSSRDATFTVDPATLATWYIGKPTLTPPLFDGSDVFEFDPARPSTEFRGPLASGSFASADPATATMPVAMALSIKIGSVPVDLPLLGARLAFTVGPGGLTQGRVNGSIGVEDIAAIVVPALATTFNQTIQADPGSQESMQLLDFFDTAPEDGSRRTVAGACRKAGACCVEVPETVRQAHRERSWQAGASSSPLGIHNRSG